MEDKTMRKFMLSALCVLVLCFLQVRAQTTEFSYQGKLNDGGAAANGGYDFEFLLFDALTGGGQVGSTVSLNNVAVTSGIFSVRLDFGNQFTSGANRFLEIRVRQSGQGGLTLLNPRQPIGSTPYSVKSLEAENAFQLGGRTANQFVQISANTNVGIGTTAPTFKLQVIDSSNTGLRVQTNAGGGTVASFGGSGAFRIDAVNVPGGRFTVLENGNVGINTAAPLDELDVRGVFRVQFLGTGGVISLCKNLSNQISFCSSSLRYKTDIASFDSGLNLVKRLRPVSFIWKEGGMRDLGLIAEEVERVEPLLTTRSDKGEIEGVRYDRLGVVLLNAVREQQTQIEAQQKEIENQKQLNQSLQNQLDRQEAEIEALKKLICRQNPAAEACRQKEEK
jgi:hypothetical protein